MKEAADAEAHVRFMVDATVPNAVSEEDMVAATLSDECLKLVAATIHWKVERSSG